ncbi:DUF2007 domain-containing protein [Pseudocolwellia sp. HL-MZ19]|uniref:putative signal transducing protein n=1 Tax=unclassified Pseudocolwellia TaxID=2848178 RepID=UPI003CEBF41E
MKMVYANENHFLVTNVRNLIEAQGIRTFIKNEFAQGAVGEISAFDSWPEVWVFDDADFDLANEIAISSQTITKSDDWVCEHCSESNDPSFEICWKCQSDNT